MSVIRVTIKRWKRQDTDWERILEKYKQFWEISTNKNRQPNSKKWVKDLNKYFLTADIFKISKAYRKMLHHSRLQRNADENCDEVLLHTHQKI